MAMNNLFQFHSRRMEAEKLQRCSASPRRQCWALPSEMNIDVNAAANLNCDPNTEEFTSRRRRKADKRRPVTQNPNVNAASRPEMPSDSDINLRDAPTTPDSDLLPLPENSDSKSTRRRRRATAIHEQMRHPTQSRFRWRLPLLVIICTYLLISTLAPTVGAQTEEDWSANCPKNCQCKWVYGKRTAECKDAGYTSIPSGFSEELQMLHLERNAITRLPREVFKNAGLINLQKIYLNGNKIEVVHRDAFRDLQILIELDLSDNRISTIDMESFDTNARLRELRLNNNPITKLSGAQFPRLEQFKVLEMKNCNVSQLSRKSFEKLTYLEHLDLSGNRFEYISVEILQPLEKLKALSLEGNPWKCDCRLKSFRDWAMSKKLIRSGVTCEKPDNLAGLDWVKLQTDNFACKPEIITLKISGQATDALIVGDVGKDITLECLVSANPPAQVRWMREGLLVNNSTTSIHRKTYVVHISGESERWVNLTIVHSQPEDAGEYTCVGENPGGTVDKNLTLNFQDVPSGAGVGVHGGDHGGHSNKSIFWILLGIVGSLVILTAAIMLICFCSRRRRAVKTNRSQDVKSETKLNGSASGGGGGGGYKENCSNGQDNSSQSSLQVQPQEQLLQVQHRISNSHHQQQQQHYTQNVLTLSSMDRYTNPNSTPTQHQQHGASGSGGLLHYSIGASNHPAANSMVGDSANHPQPQPVCRCPTLNFAGDSDSSALMMNGGGGDTLGRRNRFNGYEGLPQAAAEFEMSELHQHFHPLHHQQLIVNTFNYGGELPFEQSSTSSSSTVTGLYSVPPPSSSSSSSCYLQQSQPGLHYSTLLRSSAGGGHGTSHASPTSSACGSSKAQIILDNCSSNGGSSVVMLPLPASAMMSPTNRVIVPPYHTHAHAHANAHACSGPTTSFVNSETQTNGSSNNNSSSGGVVANNNASSATHHHIPYTNYDYNEYSDISQF